MTDLEITIKLVNEAKAGLKETNNLLNQIVQTTKKATVATQAQSNVTTSAASQITSFAAGIISAKVVMGAWNKITQAGSFALDTFKNSLIMGAQFKQMEVALKVVARNAGIGAVELDGMRKELLAINTTGSAATNVMKSFIQSGLKDLVSQVQFASGKSGFEGFIETVKDFAASIGVSSTDAIRIFTQAVATNNGQLLQQFGITEDLDFIYRSYAAQLGIASNEMTETQKRMALLTLVAEKGVAVQGVYNETYDTAGKNLLSLDDALQTVTETLGSAFEPVLAELTNEALAFVKVQRDWIIGSEDQAGHLEELTIFVRDLSTMFQFLTDDLNQSRNAFNMESAVIGFGRLTKGVAVTIATVKTLTNIFEILGSISSATIQGIINGFKIVGAFVGSISDFDITDPFNSAKRAASAFNEEIQIISKDNEKNLQNIGGQFNELTGDFQDLTEVLAFDVDKAWQDAMASTSNATESISEDVKSAFNDITDASGKMSSGIIKENKKFIDDLRKRTLRFEDQLGDLIVKHRERVSELKKDLSVERKELKKSLDEKKQDAQEEIGEVENTAGKKIEILKEEIGREKAANLENEQENIALLQREIQEIENNRNEKIAIINKELNEELALVRQKGNEKIDTIQAQLDKELKIKKQNLDAFEKFKNKEAEDDITRLRRKFLEETKELAKQHQQRLGELKTQGTQQRNAFSGGFSGGTNSILESIKQEATASQIILQQAAAALNNALAGKTGASRLAAFPKAFEEFNKVLISGITKKQVGAQRFPGGLVNVNERGGEILNLPGGTQIIPAEATKNIVNNNQSSANSTFNIKIIADKIVGTPDQAREFANEIIKNIQDIADSRGVQASRLINMRR